MNGNTSGIKVFDASAILALFFNEPGADTVVSMLTQAPGIITAVNFCEVLSKLHEIGFPISEFDITFKELPLSVIDVNNDMARYAASLRTPTKSAGLSLGDRFCIACAAYLKGVAVTSDSCWKSVTLDIPIVFIR